MTATVVVQARTGSTRFPGKVLADLAGRPLLALQLDRLRPLLARDDVGALVVATSIDAADDAVADLARDCGVEVARGPEHDVLARFGLVLDEYPADHVVRLTGDCPLADPEVVGAAVDRMVEAGADYVSNTLARTFPDGLDVEVVTAAALATAVAEAADPVEREHVTPFVYRRPRRYTLGNLRGDGDWSARRWTVDTPDDLDAVRAIVDALGRSDFGWREALDVDPRPPDAGAGLAVRVAAPGDAELLFELRNDPDAVRWSRTRRPVEPEEHRRWFEQVLSSPARRAWVAEVGGEAVGTVRVDVDEGVGTVSIGLASPWRGRGLGTGMLTALVDALGADEQVHTLVAEIHRDNEASRRAFAAAGFEETGFDGDYVVSRRPR